MGREETAHDRTEVYGEYVLLCMRLFKHLATREAMNVNIVAFYLNLILYMA